MRKQSGNFLLQALLALTLVFAFLPFLADRLSSRDMNAKLYSVKELVDTAQTAARIYLTENKDSLPYKTHIYSDADGSDKNFVSTLTSYGLSFGFNPKTIFNQDIDFIIDKQKDADGQPVIDAYLKVTQGNMSKFQLAELTRMIGVYAIRNDDSIKIYVPINEAVEYQEVVLRNDPTQVFATDLDMNNYSIEGFSRLDVNTANVHESQFTNLTFENNVTIGNLTVSGNVTYDKELEIKNGTLTVNGILSNIGNVGKYGLSSNLETNDAVVKSFTGGGSVYARKWSIASDVSADKLGVSTENLNLHNTTLKGVLETETIYVSTIKDQHDFESQNANNVNPGELMTFSDFKIFGFNWETMPIIKYRYGYNTNPGTESCKDIIQNWVEVKNVPSTSVIGMILCKYIMLERLERRIKAYFCYQSGVCK